MKNSNLYRTTLASAFTLGLMSSPVLADPGHIEATSNGHSHMLALGAVCVAIIIGGLGLLHNIKLRKAAAEKS